MKITVLGGSPKGERSVTIQYVKYLEKQFPEHAFSCIPIAREVRKFEYDGTYRNAVLEQVAQSDLVIWAYPLYFMTVSSQYMRFIELIGELDLSVHFLGVPAVSISTSIHFFDHTAQNYIQGVCDDLGMKYLGGITPKMDDLLHERMRNHIAGIFKSWIDAVVKGVSPAKRYPPLVPYASVGITKRVPGKSLPSSCRVTVVADCSNGDTSLLSYMIDSVKELLPQSRVVYLRDIKMGPCLGCLHCGFENRCAYEGKDDYLPIFKNQILPADILIFALPVVQRYFSSYWQRYLERSFNRTHQPTLNGKQIIYLVSGPLAQNQNAYQILQGYTETMRGNLVGIVTDEVSKQQDLDLLLDQTVGTAVSFARDSVKKPLSFLGVAGMNIFRDNIFANLRFVFQADHVYYKKHRLYDFPHKRKLSRIGISMATGASRLPFLRNRIQKDLAKHMVAPYEKVVSRQ